MTFYDTKTKNMAYRYYKYIKTGIYKQIFIKQYYTNIITTDASYKYTSLLIHKHAAVLELTSLACPLTPHSRSPYGR
jgi:hypothetical protein